MESGWKAVWLRGGPEDLVENDWLNPEKSTYLFCIFGVYLFQMQLIDRSQNYNTYYSEVESAAPGPPHISIEALGTL